MRLIAYRTKYHPSALEIENSNGEFLNAQYLEDVFEFMLENFDDPGEPVGHIKFTWDIDEFTAPILRAIGKDKALELYKHKKTFIKPYSIFYIPGKIFSIKSIHRNYTAKFYGIKVFFPEDAVPEDFSELYNYGLYLWEQLKKMGYRPTKLTSPIAVYQECVMKGLNMPGIDSMPERVAELAYSCSGRLWIEAHKLGHYNEIWDYDLKSAFPRIAQNMLDTRLCDYIEDTNYCSNAEYGYIVGDVTIYDKVTLHPIIYDLTGDLSSRVGTWPTTITKGQYDFIYRWKIGEVEIQEAHWVVPKRKVRPLFTVMDRLLRLKDKGGVIKHISSMQARGVYGKTGEEYKNVKWQDIKNDSIYGKDEEGNLIKFGPYCNPIWFAEASTQTSLEVADFIYRNKLVDNVIHIAVDGAMFDKKHVLTDKDKNHGWRLDGEKEEAVIISSGLAYHGTYRQAGFNIESIKKMFTEHPNLTYYQDFRTRRVTIGDISQGVEFEKLGQEYKLPTSIDLNPARDRIYSPKPATGGQILKGVYTSRPIRV